MFIALVGPNGSGKSTLARSLTESLRSMGKTVLLTREPGGSDGAEEIRRLILEGDVDRWSPETEILLFMAARRDHLEKTIWPALKRGEIVISDRYLDDTRVFQTIKNPAVGEMIERIIQATGIPEANHTFLIDVPTDIARVRVNQRKGKGGPDRFEIQGEDFDEKVRNGYLAIAKDNPHRITIVDGSPAAPEVLELVLNLIDKLLSAKAKSTS